MVLTFNADLSKTIAKKAQEAGVGTIPIADEDDDEQPPSENPS